MESRSWTGDDSREFGPDHTLEECQDCGAGPLEDCVWWCQCSHCQTGRAKAGVAEKRTA
jgi:hypothetical protein